MIDRRLLFIGTVILALFILSLFGLPPLVLWQKIQEFASNATGAAVTTRHLSDKREKRTKEATQILDGLPGEQAKENSWTHRRNP